MARSGELGLDVVWSSRRGGVRLGLLGCGFASCGTASYGGYGMSSLVAVCYGRQGASR